MEKYENLGVIGEGSYGVVLRCKHKETGQVRSHLQLKLNEILISHQQNSIFSSDYLVQFILFLKGCGNQEISGNRGWSGSEEDCFAGGSHAQKAPSWASYQSYRGKSLTVRRMSRDADIELILMLKRLRHDHFINFIDVRLVTDNLSCNADRMNLIEVNA